MKLTALLLVLGALGLAHAACPNKCSGHGMCGSSDLCECQPRWVGADCSQRECPFGLSWTVDGTGAVPAGKGLGGMHPYAECSSKGICDRGSGECQCLEGYEGRGCRRQKCPNDCSMHGQCIYNAQANSTYTADLSASYSSQFWDTGSRVCACDRGWEGIDCSQRTCPKGDDPVTDCASGGTTDVNSKSHNMVQRLYVRTAEPNSNPDPSKDCSGPMQRVDEAAGTCVGDTCNMADTATNNNECSLDIAADGSTVRTATPAANAAATAQANFYGYIALKYTDMFNGEYFTRPILIDTSAVATQPARVIDRHYQWEATKDYTYCSGASLQSELDLTTAQLKGGACGSSTTVTAKDQTAWAAADKGFYLATSTVSTSKTRLSTSFIPTGFAVGGTPTATMTPVGEGDGTTALGSASVHPGFSKGDVIMCLDANSAEQTAEITNVAHDTGSGLWQLTHLTVGVGNECVAGNAIYIQDSRGSQGLTNDQFRGSMMKRYTADRIRDALQDLPNFAIPAVNVTNYVAADGDIWGNVFDITFTDEATSGEQKLLECVFDDGRSCPGAQPKMHNRALAPTRGHCSVGGDAYGDAASCHANNGVWHSAEDVAMTVRGTCTRESTAVLRTVAGGVDFATPSTSSTTFAVATTCSNALAISDTNCADPSHVSMLFDSDYSTPTPVYDAAGAEVGKLAHRSNLDGTISATGTDTFTFGATDTTLPGWVVTFSTGAAKGLSALINNSDGTTGAVTTQPKFGSTSGVCQGLHQNMANVVCTSDGTLPTNGCDSGTCAVVAVGDHFTLAPVGEMIPLATDGDGANYGVLTFGAAPTFTDNTALYADASFARTAVKQELGITRESGCGYCNVDGFRHVTNSAECPGTCYSKAYALMEEVTTKVECGVCTGSGTTEATCGYCGTDATHLSITSAERCGLCSDAALQTKGDCTLMGGTWTAKSWTAQTWAEGHWVDNWTQGVPGQTSYKWTAIGTSNTPHQNSKSTTYIESCTVSAVDISGKNYEEHTECSNRGTCDGGSGLCTCFEGHTGESCSVQTVFF